MYADCVDLRDFYGTAVGKMARRMIRRRLRQMWPDLRGQAVLGLGYATPFLSLFRDEAERVVAFMPAPQGVLHWPQGGANLTALVEETDLPLPDLSVDRILLVHALESTEQLRPLLRECWRVLNGAGRLLVVVPNRRGLWARFDATPFGQGHPYSGGQLARLLRDTLFTPGDLARALFVPPLPSRFLLRSAPVLERLGERWFASFGGVLLLEAQKQIYAARTTRVQVRRRILVGLPQAAGARRGGGPA
ncbi:MAG: methyltransferase domain-containing protein [Thalassobaculales bacterium]